MKEIRCVACGMPMKESSDYAMSDISKNYCKYCSRPDGSMKSYEEQKDSMTNFIMKSNGLNKEEATKTAIETLSKLPAWQK